MEPYADFNANVALCRDVGQTTWDYHEHGYDDVFLHEKGYNPRYLQKALHLLCDEALFADYVADRPLANRARAL